MSYWERAGKSNERYTPSYIFEALNVIFDMDVASCDSHFITVPCRNKIVEKSLESNWSGFVWMNPPYEGRNGLRKWLSKFVQHGNGICLVPDRTSAPWFQEFMQFMDILLFTDHKIKFINGYGEVGKSPSNGSCIAGMGDKARKAILQCDLGMVVEPTW